MDFAGPFMGTMPFFIVDGHSHWLEVKPIATTTTEKTAPKQLVSDNGPHLNSWLEMVSDI